MKRSEILARWMILAGCLTLSGCGEDSATAPSAGSTPTPTPTPAASAVATLTFTSTVTGNPVPGAQVVVAGVSYTTDGAGAITLAAAAAPAATLDVSAAGFLDRATLVGGATTVTLWQIPTGADVNFVQQLAYKKSGTPEVLWRPNQGTLSLVLTGELGSDPEVRTAHIRAAAMVTALTESRVRVQLGDSGGTSGAVTLVLNAANPGTATTYLNQNGGTIQGGRIEYTTMAAARNVRVVAHELGHLLGFGHAPSGLMCPTGCGADNFTALEHAVFASMLQRTPGTSPPDNDRVLSVRSAAAPFAIHCDVR